MPPLRLFPLKANNQTELQAALNTFTHQLERIDNLAGLSAQYSTDSRSTAYRLILVGRTKAELQRQAERAMSGLNKAFAQTGQWQSPLGSYLTINPLGKRGKIAFVYPGAMNAYIGLGRDLFAMFPDLPSNGLATLKVLETIRVSSPATMLEAGTNFSVLATIIMRDYLHVEPDMAFGYSLGESSMLWSLGVWQDAQAGSRLLHDSPLWQPNPSVQSSIESYVLTKTPDEVRAALIDERHVYLTMINTPTEVVIAGSPTRCQAVITRIGCQAVPISLYRLMHCEPAWVDYDSFVRLYGLLPHSVESIRFYSAAHYAPLGLNPQRLAHDLASMVCAPLDFPRLLERLYADGARIFIELGAGRTCTRWIGDNLAGREHVAVAFNKKGISDQISLTRLLARLISHQVISHGQPLNISETFRVLNSEHREISFPQQQEHILAVGDLHAEFLAQRRAGVQQLGQLIMAQMAATRENVDDMIRDKSNNSQSLAFTDWQLKQFATGSIADCFGSAYRVYDHQRGPRIPNGDLQLIQRVLRVEAEFGCFEAGSKLVAESDLRANDWYFQANLPFPTLPYSVYMEMALQACGFLSVYLGAALQRPQEDLYYRNLDGTSQLYQPIRAGNQTLTSHAELIFFTTNQGIILETYRFRLHDALGNLIFAGETTFGYFTRQAMENQVGLGEELSDIAQRWLAEGTKAGQIELPLWQTEPSAHLALLDQLMFDPHAGLHGYLLGQKRIKSDDWFFACHFYQDSVMPGSLGVEAVYQALQQFLGHKMSGRLQNSHIIHRLNQDVTWQYRGQISPSQCQMLVEIEISQLEISPTRIRLLASANVWREDGQGGYLRIYQINDVGLVVNLRSS